MTIKTVQKLIKIGSSEGVTLPAKDLKHAGVKPGDDLLITAKVIKSSPSDQHKVEVVELTQKLIARHKKALKNLSQR